MDTKTFRPRACWQPLDRLELPLIERIDQIELDAHVERAIQVVTRAGEHGLVWYLVASIGALVDRRRRRRWLQFGITVAAGYLVGVLIKLAARRRRPRSAAFSTQTQLSFPSLHALTSFAAARMLGAMLGRAPAGPLVHVVATTVAGTRLYYRVHYPSDIVAGAALGDAIGRATVRRWRAEDQSSADRSLRRSTAE